MYVCIEVCMGVGVCVCIFIYIKPSSIFIIRSLLWQQEKPNLEAADDWKTPMHILQQEEIIFFQMNEHEIYSKL